MSPPRSATSGASIHTDPDRARRVIEASRREFDARYLDVKLSPVVGLICAYEEEDNIGAVLAAMPTEAMRFWFVGLSRAMRARKLLTPAQICTVGPSTPSDAPLPSCSAAEALERQEPFINQVLATSALAMLARLFRYGTLTHHGAFYNASTGRTSVLGVDPDLWKKIQRRIHRTSLAARKKLR